MGPITHLLLAGVITASGQTPPAKLPPALAPVPPALLTQSPKEPAPAPLTENIHAFDPRGVRLVWANRRWQLAHRGEILKDFGPREQEARQALRVIQELHLNQHAVIGSPQPVLEYWLTDGKPPPAGAHGGLRTVALDPNNLKVEQMHDQWALRDGQRTLFTFRQPEDARQALAVVRKYHFDQVGVVGNLAPMYVPMSRAKNDTPTLPISHGPASSSRQMTSPRFSRLGKSSDNSHRAEAAKSAKPGSLDGFPSAVIPPLADPSQQHDPSRSHEFHWQAKPQFIGQQSVQADSERIAFDWRHVQMRQDGGDWKLAAGGTELANFGTRINDARLALAAVRYYRFSEQNRLGAPDPYLTYYVVNRAAPRGVMLGVGGETIDADKLEVRQVETNYALCQGRHVVLKLRDREEEGRKLLDAIRRNHCDKISRIGSEASQEPMVMLLRSK